MNVEADLELLKNAAVEAGTLAMQFFRKNPSAWSKAGGSPVTEADITVDSFLRARLLAERPNYGWLSEETADDPARLAQETIFSVDPIDGTRGFIEGDDRWAVSLAIVRNGRPAVAALSVPARGELFTGVAGGGAWLGSERLAIAGRREMEGARLLGPRGWLKTSAILTLGADLLPHISSLAYRLASVAARRADAAFASPRANDWDLAASDLLVHEAGGVLTGLDGAPLRYNQEIPRHGALVAANSELLPAVLAAVAEAGAELARRRG